MERQWGAANHRREYIERENTLHSTHTHTKMRYKKQNGVEEEGGGGLSALLRLSLFYHISISCLKRNNFHRLLLEVPDAILVCVCWCFAR